MMTDKKRTILIGANDLLLAGVQRLVVDQTVCIDRTAFMVHLVVLMKFPERATFHELIPKDVVVHELSFKGLFDFSAWKEVWQILRMVRPDIVKTATFFSNTVFLGLKPFFGYTVIAAEHNTVRAKPLWQRMVDRVLLPRAFTVIADSRQVAEFVSVGEHIPVTKFTVLHNGVDVDAIATATRTYSPERENLRHSLGIPSEGHVVFTAGRLVKQKNHELMIRGFSIVAKSRHDAYLCIAGEGGLRQELEAEVRALGLEGRVIFLGGRKDIHRFYTVADSFLLTSRHEGFCIAAMEALAFGLPVVSTRVAGVEEYLVEGKNGFFIESTPKSIAITLQRVIELPEGLRKRMGEAGKDTAESFSVKRYGEAFNAILTSIE